MKKNKSENKILIAFMLNFFFSIFELIGGIFTNSISIMSDSIHDIGDSISIGLSYFFERISKRNPDKIYTYGYLRYSVIGSLITTIILLLSSIFVIYNAIFRIINPTDINYNGMIVFALIGTIVNIVAVYFTKGNHSLNQKSVNLHMLEDVLGWIIVLIGAIIIKFTNVKIIDPILSILLAVFIFKNALSNFKTVLDLFLEKIPNNLSIDELKKGILENNDIIDVHHIHVWSIDGYNNYATMHIIIDGDYKKIKKEIKNKLKEYGINHTTIEFETKEEKWEEVDSNIKNNNIN